MVKTVPKRKHILRNILLGIAAVPVLLILFIVGTLLLSPVFDAIDQSKFTKLDNQSRELYAQLQAASGGAETWEYEASCYDMNRGQGGFSFTADYRCGTKIFTELPVASAVQLNDLHEKYYPVVDGSKILKPFTELDKQRPSAFGVKFVSSTGEKQYKTSEGDIKCRYLIELSDGENIGYGIPLNAGNAIVTISLECSDKSREDWYAQ